MSVLDIPRIVFGGQISWDPIVTNNYTTEYIESTSWTALDFGESAEGFRQNATSSASVIDNGNWNPHGTHRSSFYNSAVTGADLGTGIVTNDPFVSCPAYFDGMLVDLEPYGAFTSQLFFDSMSFGIEGGCRIYAPRSYRFTARYINFFRLPRKVYGFAASVASVMWQTSFAKSDGLQIDPYNSQVLAKLTAALQTDQALGLTVRFNTYSTHYYGAADPSQIPALEQAFVKKLAGGGFQPNPARSKVVGAIGLWLKGEPPHEPGDRAMLAALPGPPNFVASAFAKLGANNKLTIDLSNSIAETDLQETKQDLGPLTVSAVSPLGPVTQLGTIAYTQYNRDAYRASAGIVSLQLNASQAKDAAFGNLKLTDQTGKTLLLESSIRAIPNDPNLYVDVSDQTTPTQVSVYNKGVPAGSGISVAMELDSPSVSQSTVAVTDTDGVATFDIQAPQGQVQGFVLIPDPKPNVPGAINPQATTYMYVRSVPDPPAVGPDLPPTWENVYQYCLINWNAMAPCMDNWLDLNNEEQVKAYAPIIKKLTDPANFESYRFMPITRDMGAGQRQLLYSFLDGAKAAPEAKALEEEVEPVDYAELSRKMRHAK